MKKSRLWRQRWPNWHAGIRLHPPQPRCRLCLSSGGLYHRAEQGNRGPGIPGVRKDQGQLPQVSSDNGLSAAKAQWHPACQFNGIYESWIRVLTSSVPFVRFVSTQGPGIMVCILPKTNEQTDKNLFVVSGLCRCAKIQADRRVRSACIFMF